MEQKWNIKNIIISFFAGIIVSLCVGYFVLEPKAEDEKKVYVEMTVKRPKPYKNEQKCRAKIAECISKGKLGDAEYYLKSYKRKSWEERYCEWQEKPTEDLIQAYVDNGYIDKAVSLVKWSGSDIANPIYEYYMMINEFNLAEEFLPKKNSTEPYRPYFMQKYATYYNHLDRVIVIMLNTNNASEAKQFLKEKSVYFDDVANEWKEYRNRDEYGWNANNIDGNMKPYFKEAVVKKLMSKINTYESSK